MRSSWLTGLGCAAIAAASGVIPFPATAAITLIVPPTSLPNPNIVVGFNDLARSRYVQPFYPAFGATCSDLAENCVGINYPATFWPTSGGLRADTWNLSVATGVDNLNDVLLLELATSSPDEPINLFGYSQGARVVSTSLQNLVNNLPPSFQDRLSVSLTGNISRPNGGVWARFTDLPTIPILDITFGEPTPTDVFEDCNGTPSQCRITDISFEYDGVSDFPLYLFNGLAVANALAGFISFPHPTYMGPVFGGLPDGYTPEELAEQMNEALHPENFAYFGDTRYVTIPSPELPIVRVILGLTPAALQPLVRPLMELVEPVMRWRIDQAYDRSINPGEATPIRMFRIPFVDYDPLEEFSGFVEALRQGIENVTGGKGNGSGSALDGTVHSATSVEAAAGPSQIPPVGDPIAGASATSIDLPARITGDLTAAPPPLTTAGVHDLGATSVGPDVEPAIAAPKRTVPKPGPIADSGGVDVAQEPALSMQRRASSHRPASQRTRVR